MFMEFDGFYEMSRQDPTQDIPIHITLFNGAAALAPGVTGAIEVTRPQPPPGSGTMQKIIQALGGIFFKSYVDDYSGRTRIIYHDPQQRFIVRLAMDGTAQVKFEVQSEV